MRFISCEPKLAKHLQTRRVRLARMILALAVPRAAKGERLWLPVAVSKLGGIRTEEARALRWSEVDLGCVPTPAPPGSANRCHCAGPAVRQQRNDRRRPNLTR
jgi:hypothetical protein